MTTLTMKIPTIEELRRLTLGDLATRAGVDFKREAPKMVTVIWIMPEEREAESPAFGMWKDKIEWKGKTTKEIVEELRRKAWGPRFYRE